MIFVNVRLSNAGEYVCVATNENGKSRSTMSLTVEKVELPNVRNVTPIYAYDNRYISYEFPCSS